MPALDAEGLVRYQGKYWSWWGQKDAKGHLLLQQLLDTSLGVLADPRLCKVIEGEEYAEQMDAIRWFRSKGVC